MLDTIRAALATQRAGRPVAARLFLELGNGANGLPRQSAVAANALVQIFDCQIDSLAVFGSPASGQLSSLLRFSQGQSALVSVNATSDRRRGESFVFAERGTLHCEFAGDDERLSEFETVVSAAPDATTRQLEDRIVAQLATARPKLDARPFPTPLTPAATTPPYGVLLVSGDHTHQPGYADALAADPRCHLVAVTDESDIPDRRRQKNVQLAERLGIPYLDNIDDALARDDIQIVSVCAEPYRRGAIIEKAALAGKHLYLDKPLCGSQIEADAIVAAVRSSGVVAHMFSQISFDPALKARARVASRQLGNLIAIHADLCFAKGHAGTAKLGQARSESAEPERYELVESKRELTNVGIYNVVLLLWLTGRCVRRVAASTGNYFFAEHQANDMEDFGQILLEFDDGLTATISAGRLGWKSHPSSGLNRTYLVGTQSSSIVDAHAGRVEMWSSAEAWQPPARDPEDPMGMWQAPPDSPYKPQPKLDWMVPGANSWQLDTDHFLNCVEQGRPSDVSVELAAAATEILLAAYRSAATGQVVDLAHDSSDRKSV